MCLKLTVTIVTMLHCMLLKIVYHSVPRKTGIGKEYRSRVYHKEKPQLAGIPVYPTSLLTNILDVIMQQSALVINPVTVHSFASLFSCRLVGRASDPLMGST